MSLQIHQQICWVCWSNTATRQTSVVKDKKEHRLVCESPREIDENLVEVFAYGDDLPLFTNSRRSKIVVHCAFCSTLSHHFDYRVTSVDQTDQYVVPSLCLKCCNDKSLAECSPEDTTVTFPFSPHKDKPPVSFDWCMKCSRWWSTELRTPPKQHACGRGKSSCGGGAVCNQHEFITGRKQWVLPLKTRTNDTPYPCCYPCRKQMRSKPLSLT